MCARRRSRRLPRRWPCDGKCLLPLVLDVTDRDAWSACAARVRSEWGGVDLLCSNAGVNFRRLHAPGHLCGLGLCAGSEFRRGDQRGAHLCRVHDRLGTRRAHRHHRVGGRVVCRAGRAESMPPRSMLSSALRNHCVRICGKPESGSRCCVRGPSSRSCSRARRKCGRRNGRPPGRCP
jgi:hypothetical protein